MVSSLYGFTDFINLLFQQDNLDHLHSIYNFSNIIFCRSKLREHSKLNRKKGGSMSFLMLKRFSDRSDLLYPKMLLVF